MAVDAGNTRNQADEVRHLGPQQEGREDQEGVKVWYAVNESEPHCYHPLEQPELSIAPRHASESLP